MVNGPEIYFTTEPQCTCGAMKAHPAVAPHYSRRHHRGCPMRCPIQRDGMAAVYCDGESGHSGWCHLMPC